LHARSLAAVSFGHFRSSVIPVISTTEDLVFPEDIRLFFFFVLDIGIYQVQDVLVGLLSWRLQGVRLA